MCVSLTVLRDNNATKLNTGINRQQKEIMQLSSFVEKQLVKQTLDLSIGTAHTSAAQLVQEGQVRKCKCILYPGNCSTG